jgi:Glycosyltransferase family 87
MAHHSFLKNKVIRLIIIWALLLAGVYVLLQLSPILSQPTSLPIDDYFHLWAAGKLNIQGKDPFSDQLVEQLRIFEGGNPSITKISVMLNPPWFITILIPFSLLSYPISRLVWLIFSIIQLLLSAMIFWHIYSGVRKLRWLAVLAVFIFGPTISMLMKGQITSVAVLGIALFLYFSNDRRKDWLAGISISLITVKPQTVILFWIILALWIIKEKRWIIPFSFCLSIITLSLITVSLNHAVFIEYFVIFSSYKISDWATPTIGSYLRFFWLGIDKFWLQYLPAIIGGAWAVYYWFKHHQAWNWEKELPIILLASLVLSPYSWSYDLVISIPAIILVTHWLIKERKHWINLFVVLIYLSINTLDLFLHQKLDEFWFIWLAPVFLLFYLLLQKYFSIETANAKLAKQSVG